VTAVRALHSRAGRRKARAFLTEGPQAVEAALQSGASIREVFVVDSDVEWTRAAQVANLRVTTVTADVLAAMAETEQPQGVLAVCDLLPSVPLETIMDGMGPVLVLEALSDPGNVGTAIRTADAVGAAGVILTPESADIHNGKVIRATAGSVFHVPCATGIDLDEVVGAARRAGRSIAVATGDGSVDLFAAVSGGLVNDSTVWLIGSEAHGISARARSLADHLVSIPMRGGAESLNAAVAAAVVLYVTRHGDGASTQAK